jgi:CrcB protein
MGVTRFDLRRLGAIYVGGVLGALARVGLAEAAPHGPGGWPWATFAVNMAGALLLGYFVARLRDHPEDSLVHPLLTTGICGTLFQMVEGGHFGLAAAYVGATLAVGYAFMRLGVALERRPEVAN